MDSVTMILFANIAYNEMRGFVMGACETIAGITRCLVCGIRFNSIHSFIHSFIHSSLCRVLFFSLRYMDGLASKNPMESSIPTSPSTYLEVLPF